MEELFTLESSNGFTVEVAVSETADTLKNTSDVTVGLRVKSAYYKNYIYYLSGSVKIDGTPLVTMNSTVSTHNVSITAYNTYYNVVRSSDSYTDSPWTLAGIAHNTDGSKTVKLEVEVRGYTYGGGGSGWSVSTSRTLTLTHIPRASTIGATDANIGAVSNIAVSRKSSAYTHTIAYAFGSLSGYIGEDGSLWDTAVQLTDTAIAFPIPTAFYGQIPNAKKGTCILTCRTYSGTTQVGDAQTASFTVTAAKSQCAPSLSGTVVDTNEQTLTLTGDANTLVRYASNALCTMTAAAKNSATMAEKTIGGVAVTGTTRTISAIESDSVVFACTDSRGYSASVTVKKTLVPYIHLTANVTAKRTDPTSGKAVLSVSGKYYPGTFGEMSNILTIEYSVNGGDAVALEGTLADGSYQAEVSLSGLDYLNAHSIQVTVSDCLERVAKTVTVGKGIPVFDWGESDFQVHVPVYVEGVDVASVAAAAQTTATAAKKTADAAAPKSSLKCFGSLTDIGITEFPTTVSAVAAAMPSNSMIVIDTRRINGDATYSNQTISDWGTTANGVALICKGFSNARMTMMILYGISAGIRGALWVGNFARDTNTVNWTNYGNCAQLYSGSLTSGSTTFRYSDYRLFVIVGKTASTGSLTSVTVPREAITTADVAWMLSGSNYYLSFCLKYSGDTVTLTYKDGNGSGGCIAAVYGIC